MNSFREEALHQELVIDTLDTIIGKLSCSKDVDRAAALKLTIELAEELSLFDIYQQLGPGERPVVDNLDKLLSILRFLRSDLQPNLLNPAGLDPAYPTKAHLEHNSARSLASALHHARSAREIVVAARARMNQLAVPSPQ